MFDLPSRRDEILAMLDHQKVSAESSLLKPIQEEKLISIITHLYGSETKISSLTLKSGSRINTVYHCKLSSPSKDLYVRIAPPNGSSLLSFEVGSLEYEKRVYSLLNSRSQIPIPILIKVDSSRKIIDRDYMIYDAIQGVSLLDIYQSLSLDQESYIFQEIGWWLAQFHTLVNSQPGSVLDSKVLNKTLHSQTWREFFYSRLLGILSDLVSTNAISSEEYSCCKQKLEKIVKIIPEQVNLVLLHMDFWLGNLLMNWSSENQRWQLAGILDFDRVIWGHNELELSLLEAWGMANTSFYLGYTSVNDVAPDYKARKGVYVLYWELERLFVTYTKRWQDVVSFSQRKKEFFVQLDILYQKT